MITPPDVLNVPLPRSTGPFVSLMISTSSFGGVLITVCVDSGAVTVAGVLVPVGVTA